MTTDPRWEQVERELNIALRYYESGTIRGASFRDALAALRSRLAKAEQERDEARAEAEFYIFHHSDCDRCYSRYVTPEDKS